MSTIIIYTHFHEGLAHKLLLTAVILLASAIIYWIFGVAVKIGSSIGETPTTIMNRVMGLIIGSIGIEFILDGIAEHFPNLVG